MLSVIVPVHRPNLGCLLEAVDSLNSQTFRDFTVYWVYSERHCESSVKLIRSAGKFNSVFLVAPSKGLPAALNFGIQAVPSEFIARFDADDVCHPDRFRAQIEFLQLNPEISLCGSNLKIINDKSEVISYRNYPTTNKAIGRAFIWSSPIAHPAIMVRRDLFLRFNYNDFLNYAEDLDLFLRLRNANVKFYNLPLPLLNYRESVPQRPRMHLKMNLKVRIRNVYQCSDLLALGISAINLILPIRLYVQLKRLLYSKKLD